MKYYSESITNLIEELASLPNIGPKSAQRLALHILNLPEARVKHLADSILTAKQKICFCKECFNLSDQELCQVIWQLMRKPDSTRACTMCFMVR